MDAVNDVGRRALLERYARFYGEQHFAVVFTAGIAGDDAKRVTAKGWDAAIPLADPDYAAGLIGGRGERRNPAIVLRPSRLVGVESDGPDDLDTIAALGLPPTLTVRSSDEHRRHHYFRPPASLDGGVEYVAFRFEHGRVSADAGRYFVAPPALHPSGRVYEFLPGLGPGEVEIAELPEAIYWELAARAGRQAPLGETGAIPKGARNETLTRVAGRLRRAGVGPQLELEERLQEYNQTACEEPLDPREVRRIAASIATRSEDEFEHTDLGNARSLAALFSQCSVRYVASDRRWLVFQDGRWRGDETEQVVWIAKELADERLRHAITITRESARKRAVSWALASQSAGRIRAALELAGSEREVVLTREQLDRDPWLLACANGTLDLRTGLLRAADPADLISRGSDVHYDPGAACPRWELFLTEVFGRDEELIAFVRRLCGYLLTGDTREHVLPVLHGTGCNGKSTLVETVKRVLGDFALTAAFDSFARGRHGESRNDIARLHRARLVVASESGEGRKLDEATVKVLTGGDTITARFLYGEFFEFQPRFKLLLITNHKPRVEGDDDAIWRRLRLVPFDVSFLGRETTTCAQRSRPSCQVSSPGPSGVAASGGSQGSVCRRPSSGRRASTERTKTCSAPFWQSSASCAGASMPQSSAPLTPTFAVSSVRSRSPRAPSGGGSRDAGSARRAVAGAAASTSACDWRRREAGARDARDKSQFPETPS